MRISEIYQTTQSRIQSNDIEDFKDGLTIHKAKIIGETRQGVLLSFKETSLEHKCSRVEVFRLAEKFQTNDTDDFVGKKITLEVDDNDIVRVFPMEEKKKE